MLFQLAADFIIVLHFTFILFVLVGGILVLKWRWLIWLHLPAVIWGALISFMGWICPLTPLENMLRQAGGGEVYLTGFIEQYIVPLIYPSGFNHEMFVAIGLFVVVVNVIVYAFIFNKRGKNKK